MSRYNFLGKVVIVTGASSGLGAAIAKGFAAEGAKIAVTGRNKAGLEQVVQKCQEIGLPESKILPLVLDHAKDEDNSKTITETIGKFGQLDVLINNAGLVLLARANAVSMDDYETMMNINAKAPFCLTQHAIPHLRKTKGNIVNISSVAGIRGFRENIPYSMTKSAVDNLTRSSCLELARDGIRVNSVNPGYIPTSLVRRAGFPDEIINQKEEAQRQQVPLGRNGQPHEVTDAVLFLASDKASYITGVNLPVDGGRTAQ